MVKRREIKPNQPAIKKEEPTAAQVEAFANMADGETKEIVLDKNAPRKFKTISVPFNEYEYEELLKGVNLSGRTKLNFIRYAMLKLVKDQEEER